MPLERARLNKFFTQTAREIASLDDMVKQNLINIGRGHRTEL